LLEWIEQEASIGSKAPSVLEVGSGFGFTLGAAMARGWRTAAVDINPAAARGARALYGIETVTATLGEALDAGTIERGAWDVVLYQFVLEHLAEPEVELRHAAEVIAPGGHLAVVVPNMSTFELDVFGASYRSLRADHRHLFSLASLRSYLASQGFGDVAHRTTCSLHLVRGFLDARELDDLYANDRGPDLFLLARRNVWNSHLPSSTSSRTRSSTVIITTSIRTRAAGIENGPSPFGAATSILRTRASPVGKPKATANADSFIFMTNTTSLADRSSSKMPTSGSIGRCQSNTSKSTGLR
jgi:SAM-dependent methyltransferase